MMSFAALILSLYKVQTEEITCSAICLLASLLHSGLL